MHLRTLALTAALAVSLSAPPALASASAGQAAHAGHAGHAPSARAGAFTVTASAFPVQPVLGEKVLISGKVRPAAPRAEVALQVKYAGRGWKTVDYRRLNGSSEYTFKDKVGSLRERRYRVVKAAAGQRRAGRATTGVVTVFGWRDLITLPATQNQGFGTGPKSINGTAYPASTYTVANAPQPAHVDYNLNRGCKQLTGTFGLADDSASAGRATVSLTADGTPKYIRSFALAQSEQVSADVSGVFRITLAAVASDGGIGALGTPRVLCSF